MNILLVDDDNTANFIAKRLIEKTFQSTRINVAKNSKETLVNLKNQKDEFPNAIFLDINLGIENGWEILDKILKLKEKGAIKKIPNIVILSSSIYDGDKEKAKEHENVVSYVSKPLSVDKLENIKILLN
tara:strand:+ start:599 stop:985 length:387 start_codon:yes stop_codon:yes gene_type:complete